MRDCYFEYVTKGDILMGINGKNINKMGLTPKDIQIIFQNHPTPFTATFIRQSKTNNKQDKENELNNKKLQSKTNNKQEKENELNKKKLQSIERQDDDKLIKITKTYEKKQNHLI
eukprot:176828_1